MHGPDGSVRTIHRMVGSNGSFGGNSLVETIGLLDATSVSRLAVTWPAGHTTQTFHDLAADQFLEIHEGSNTLRAISLPMAHPTDHGSAPDR